MNVNHSSAQNATPLRERRVLLPTDMSDIELPANNLVICHIGGQSMGTTWSVKCYRSPLLDESTIVHHIENALERIIQQMSSWNHDSELSRFNHAEKNSWHHLSDEFFYVIDTAIFYAQQSQTAFDPAIGRLVNLWGFGPHPKRTSPPSQAEIQEASAKSGWRHLQLQRTEKKLLQVGEIALDLSGIAKGFAVDYVAQTLEKIGIHSYLVEIGGELRGKGCQAHGQPWWVSIAQVEQPQETAETVIALYDLSIATSGDYLRHFEYQGQRYSHTLDPRTGAPIQHHCTSVSVIHKECMRADALATVLHVLGLEAGMQFAKQEHIACRFICREESHYSEFLSPAWLAMQD